MFIAFIEREERWGGEKERNIHAREKPPSPASYICPTRDETLNPGMCTEWELNLQSFGAWDGAPANCAIQPGQKPSFLYDEVKSHSIAEVSNPRSMGHMHPRMAVNAAQHKVINLLKTFFFTHQFSLVFVYLMCSQRQVFFFQCGPEMLKSWTPLLYRMHGFPLPRHKEQRGCQSRQSRRAEGLLQTSVPWSPLPTRKEPLL